MARVTEEQVLDALGKIVDTDNGKNVVELGMITGLAVKDGNVGFAVEVDAADGERKEPLRKACEAAVDALPGVLSVTAVLTAHQASAAAEKPKPHVAAPATGDTAKPLIPGITSILAVASGKGGVGKSTTAVNIALGLAADGHSIGLLDSDIYGPSIPRMMGISGRPVSADGKTLQPMTNYNVRCMSMGFLVEEDTPMIWRGPMVTSAIDQMLRDVDWGELDVLVIDLPPGTGDAQLTLSQKVPLTGAVIISTPQDIALIDARKGLNMFRKVDVPVLGIIENMSYFDCPECGHRSEIFSHGGARREADKLGTEFLGEIPLDIAIRETSDNGTPIVVSRPDSPLSEIYRSIARRIKEKLDAEQADASRAAPKIVIQ